jgi:hypothetical protein
MLKPMQAVIGAAVSLFLALSAAHAQSGPWRIVDVSGTVRATQPAASMQLVSTGEAFAAGSVLSTGMDSRVVLRRGEQQIVVGPNSRMSLPATEEPGMTRIFQDMGTLLFKVDKREKQHFRVETPVIAAVVKGTTFTVTAGANDHAVHVAEGAVEVSSRNGQAVEMVTAGMTARISGDNPSFIEISNSAASDGNDRGPAARPAKLKEAQNDKGATRKDVLFVPANIGAGPLDFAGLTDGLVNAPEARLQHASPVSFANNTKGLEQSETAGAIGDFRRNATNNNSAAASIGAGNANVNAGGGANANADVGGANATANAESGAANSANTNANANVNAGGGAIANANANASANANANASAGASGSANANVNVGGDAVANANANVNTGGGANANTGSPGVNLNLNIGGDNGVNIGAGVNGNGGAAANVGIGGLGANLELP